LKLLLCTKHSGKANCNICVVLFAGAICGGVAAREQNVLRALLAELGHPEIVPRKAQWRQRHCDQNPQVTNEAASRGGTTRGWQQSLSYPSGRPPRGGLNQSQRTHSSPPFSAPEQNTNNKKQKHVRRERRSLAHSHTQSCILSGILEHFLRKYEEKHTL
jgi:hypothetical protein